MSHETSSNGWRTFLIAWATQSVSVLGTALTFFAMTIWLTLDLYPSPDQKPQLALAISGLALAFSLPAVLGQLFAGAWADRRDRQLTMYAMNLMSGAASVFLAYLLISHALNIWLLLLLMLIYATLGTFHGAAFDASYAMLVPDEHLARANGMMQTTSALAAILAPGLAAVLIALPELARQAGWSSGLGVALAGLQDGVSLAIALDAITFFLAAAALLFLYIPSPEGSELMDGTNDKGLWADVQQGIAFITSRRALLWLLLVFAVSNFGLAPIDVLVPLLLKFNLAGDWMARGLTFEAALALLSSIAGIGGIVGGSIISVWGGLKTQRVYGVLLPIALGGLLQAAFGLVGLLYLAAALSFFVHLMIPFSNTHSQAIWQSQTPRQLQGRVFAVRRLIAWCTIPLSTGLAGVLGGWLNPGLVLAGLGLLRLGFTLTQFFNPELVRLEQRRGEEWPAGVREG